MALLWVVVAHVVCGVGWQCVEGNVETPLSQLLMCLLRLLPLYVQYCSSLSSALMLVFRTLQVNGCSQLSSQ